MKQYTTKGADAENIRWTAEDERLHGPSNALRAIRNESGDKLEALNEELEAYEGDTGIVLNSDEIRDTLFADVALSAHEMSFGDATERD